MVDFYGKLVGFRREILVGFLVLKDYLDSKIA